MMTFEDIVQRLGEPLKSCVLYERPVERKNQYKVTLLGLGDVGGTLLIGLRLLGRGIISEIGIYDLSEEKLNRWEMELNQIVDPNDGSLPVVKRIDQKALFTGDMFIFTASRFVPEVGSDVKDVRMAQFESNKEIIEIYAKQADACGYKGIFAVVSDPVDLLCAAVQKAAPNLAKDQIRGYGLGVMYGRAKYYAAHEKMHFERGRAFGPHGKALVIANDIIDYDEMASQTLTNLTIEANLKVREAGFKPYIAPALSSGAISILHTLTGEWHYSAVALEDYYLGIRNRYVDGKTEVECIPDHPLLVKRIRSAIEELRSIWR
ncbi:MAG: lactate dehydrogenase [Clostridia bacterium]|nr:lactate dehydrogenase [Clostridia bacterium]